jgi:Rrf2 family protein
VRVALGRKGDYAVRAVIDLARHWERGRRKTREIAEEMDIPPRYLAQILATLVHHGLLTAVAGPDGGYALANEPSSTSLLEVVEAVEGPIALEECVLRGGPCDWTNACPLHPAWVRAQSALVDELRATTFDELARIDDQLEAGTYGLPTAAPAHPKQRSRRGARTEAARALAGDGS